MQLWCGPYCGHHSLFGVPSSTWLGTWDNTLRNISAKRTKFNIIGLRWYTPGSTREKYIDIRIGHLKKNHTNWLVGWLSFILGRIMISIRIKVLGTIRIGEINKSEHACPPYLPRGFINVSLAVFSVRFHTDGGCAKPPWGQSLFRGGFSAFSHWRRLR